MATTKQTFRETCLQSSKAKLSRFSSLTPKAGQRRIRDCRSCQHRTIHICQNATTPEKFKKPGAFGEWHT